MKKSYINQLNTLEAKVEAKTQYITIDPIMEGRKWTNKVLINELYINTIGQKEIKNTYKLTIGELMEQETLKDLFTGKVIFNFSPLSKTDLNAIIDKYIHHDPPPLDETIKEVERYLQQKKSPVVIVDDITE